MFSPNSNNNLSLSERDSYKSLIRFSIFSEKAYLPEVYVDNMCAALSGSFNRMFHNSSDISALSSKRLIYVK